NERRRESGEEKISSREMTPLRIRIAPAQREHGKNPLSDRTDVLAITEHRDVGDQSDEEEGTGYGEVREDREHVPHQRTLELRPDVAPVRVWDQPEEFPGAAEVQDREQRRSHDRENRHRFRAAVNRRSEPRAEQV